MATWRKVITSGSQAHLKSLVTATEIGVPAAIDAANPSNISASAIFASSSNGGSGTGDIDKIAIVSQAAGVNEVFYTSSAALTTTVNELTFGDGISGSLITATSTGWDGTAAGTINIDTASLAGNGITGATADKLTINADSTVDNITLNGSDTVVKTSTLAGFGLTTPSAFAPITASVDGSTVHLSASGTPGAADYKQTLTASIADLSNQLAQGNGITNFTYNGGTSGKTISVDPSEIFGDGLSIPATNDRLDLQTGSAANDLLKPDGVIKYDNSKTFKGSTITSSATTITLGGASSEISIPGTLEVAGTFSGLSKDFLVKDQFFLLNSGSGKEIIDDFGYIGQTGSLADREGMGWNYDGSKRWAHTTGSMSNTGVFGGKVGEQLLFVNAEPSTADDFFLQKGNMLKYDDSSGAGDELYIYAPANNP